MKNTSSSPAKSPRRQNSAEGKVRLLRLHLVEGQAAFAICDEPQILPSPCYQWQKTFFENGAAAREFRALLVQDLRTGTPWALKENLDKLRAYRQWSRAVRFLCAWLDAALTIGLRPLGKAADMIGRHARASSNIFSTA